MAAKIVVTNINQLPLDVSDLVYLFGTCVDVLAIDFKSGFANVVVPTLSDAARAIHELDGRILQHPNGDLVQMQLSLKKQSPARQPTKQLPPARIRPDLAHPIWKFYVSNLGTNTDFNVVLELFRPFGAIVWSSRDASGTHGSVMVKTSAHWTIVTDTLRGTTLAGNRLYVTIDRKHMFATCYKGVAVSIPAPLAKGFRMMQILIGGLSRKGRKYEGELRWHFQRWGQVVRISFNFHRKICCLDLKSRYSADEILRQMGPVVIRGRRLDVTIPVEDKIEDVTTGEKNNGYEVLYQNMKYGLSATKELAEYFRERSNLEEYNSKLLTKLANKAGSGGGGTFSPLWIILKSTTERLSELHAAKVQKLSELVKNITKYAEELHKKHKTVKEEESGTQDAVQAMKDSTAAVAKAKDVYNARLQELEKARKDSSTKETEKAEAKLRKQQDDYKALVEKHNIIKQEFEKKMTITCKRFQDLEEAHLKQMKEFLTSYMEIVQNNFDLVGQVHHDLKRQFLELTVDKLLEQFVLNKYTGLEKPEFIELDLVNLSGGSLASASATSNNLLVNTSISPSAATSPGGGGGGGSVTDSPALSTTSSSQPVPIVKKESNLRSWFTSSSSAAVPTNSPVNLSTSSPTASGGMAGRGGGNLLDALAGSADRPLSPVAASGDSSASSSAQSTAKTSKPFYGDFLSKTNHNQSTPQNKQQQTPQMKQEQDSQQPPPQQQQQQQKSSRRTTSLLNLFMSNSQGSRESRDSTTSGGADSVVSTSTTGGGGGGTAAISAPTSPNDAHDGSGNGNGYNGVASSFIGRNPLLRGSKFSGFLRSRREKAKSKKTKKKKDSAENSSAKDDKGSDGEDKEEATVKATDAGSIGNLQTTSAVSTGNVAPTATPEVDEDGYSIQPRDATWDSATITEKSNNFYSSSDSDSDDERGERKIHVEIKPLNNGVAPISASVDELRATVENLSLSPIAPFSSQHSHHHSSASHHLTGAGVQAQSQHNLSSTGGGGGGGTAQPGTAGGLLNNNNNTHLTSPNASNASTPTTVHPYAPLQSPTLSMSTTSNNRYADLGDIFSEVGDISASAPASANLTKLTQRQIPTPTSAGGSSIAIPRPPSRRSEAAAAAAGRGRVSPASQIARADSVGSLEFRSPSVGIGSSRGPSPLTIGMSDTIPLAVAFHEIIHAYFRGSDETRCQVKMSGDMMLSFPAGIVNVLANNPNPAKLGFRIKNLQNLENVLPNKQLITIDKLQSTALSTTLEFNMPVLTSILRRQSEQNPTAPYFNVDILKYQVKAKPGAASCPFQLVSYWKCEQRHTDIKIDYKYNSHAMAVASPLLNVSISVPVDGSVKNVQSKPHSAWQGESNRLVWNFTDISQHSDNGGVDTLRARLEVGTGPSNPALISTQFNCEGTTLSGIEFELVGTGYRLSLVKRRFVSGKYICEGDGVRGIKTPTPPNVGVLSPSPYSNKSAGSGGSG
ncbi:F-BAR domain only protein 2 isoform X6 [Culex quinquefasciatus]|uniref:F-BAR domain only protein 2 isoform X6 n=1 Tax=Culex quinquefasciatus TaxID=7176 RepID=UPI0018E338ED|nr:F-BAR domain only protein 2 isoform X6 [Culex quinquefasciatus]